MALLRSSSIAGAEPFIDGGQVLLRPPLMSDYTEWAQLRAQGREFLTPWEPTWLADELARSAYRRRIRHYQRELQEESGYAFFVIRASDRRLLGGLTLSNVRRGVTQAATLGYWIGAQHARKGHMTAAVRALMPFVFDQLDLHRLEAACLLTNQPSIRLLKRVGFVREGVARRYLKINGTWRDHILYALLDTDPAA